MMAPGAGESEDGAGGSGAGMGPGPGSGLWKLSAVLDAVQADALETVIGDTAVALSRFAIGSTSAGTPRLWRLEALFDAAPDVPQLALALAEVLAVPARTLPRIAVEPLAAVDWLALNRAQFPPVAAGRFFVHGTHFTGTPPAGALALCLDAGPAFGSGTHETTKGCLLAIDEIVAGRRLRNALDLGCGSGILALAIAKAAEIKVLASDIDPVAAATTRANARANGLADRVVAVAGEGVAGEEVGRGAPYDLIVANILAEPLIALAPGVAGLLAPGGQLVLSGLLTVQEPQVCAAYAAAGLTPGRTIVLGDWSTMILSLGV